MKIYSYQKTSDAYTTYQAQGTEAAPVQELCTIEGVTYFAGPDVLPPQPTQISVAEVTLTDALREQIKAASPHCQLIYRRMEEQIRAKYSADDEMFLTRIGVGQALGAYSMSLGEKQELGDYQLFVEGVRQWGRDQRALLGL